MNEQNEQNEPIETIYNELIGSVGNDVISIHQGNKHCIINAGGGFDYVALNGNKQDWTFIVDTEKEAFVFINKGTGQDIIVNDVECINFDDGGAITGIKEGFQFNMDREYSLSDCFTGINNNEYSLIGHNGLWISDCMY
jgi:Ca2+-binding RTX toxin-like protein